MLCQPHKEKVLLYSTNKNSKLTQSKIYPYSILSKTLECACDYAQFIDQEKQAQNCTVT